MVCPPPSLFLTVKWLSTPIFLAVAIGLVFVLWRPNFVNGGTGRLAFAVLGITHPATLSHFLYDSGRFDQIGFIVALACLLSMERGRTPLVVLASLCITAILVHEAFLLIYVPIISAYWAYVDTKSQSPWLKPVAMAAIAVVVTIAISLIGPPGVSRQHYYQELVQLHGPWIRDGSVGVLYGSLTKEMGRAVDLLMSGRRIIQHLTLACFLAPMILIAMKIAKREAELRRSSNASDRSVVWVMIAAASPLSLYVVGVDFARWWALTITNLLVALALIMTRSSRWSQAVEETLAHQKTLVWVGLGLNLVAGPLGVAASPFPNMEPLIRATALAAWHAVR